MTKTTQIPKGVVILDCEATIHAKGNPFSRSNALMCVGILDHTGTTYFDIEHSQQPYGDALRKIRQLVNEADLVVGFNIKYDLHWLRRYIPDLCIQRVFDCQLAEFLLTNQQSVYPSLELCSERYNLPPKFVDIEELWNAGIDTREIPREILERRVVSDVIITGDLWAKQAPILEKQGKKSLFDLQCADLLVLEEMEFNGMLFDTELARKKNETVTAELDDTITKLNKLVDCPHINWDSNYHLSAVLYGGFINIPSEREIARTLKSGAVSIRKVKDYAQLRFPRLVRPLPKSEVVRTATLTDADLEAVNTEQYAQRKPLLCRSYFVNESTLKSLGATGKAKSIISLMLKQSELAKLRTTYYEGLPKLIAEMDWTEGTIHGSLNQCVARTGRLSSSSPNLQNFANVIKDLFPSRYGEH